MFFRVGTGIHHPHFADWPWAAWPGIADFAIVLLAVVVVLTRRFGVRPNPASRSLLRWVFGVYALVLLSVLSSRFWIVATGGALFDDGLTWGVFQTYKLTQFVFVFIIAANVPYTPARRRVLRRIIVFVQAFVGLGMLLAYFQVISPDVYVFMLPNDKVASGAWYIYFRYADLGLVSHFSTIGYNHAYHGAQTLLLFMFYAHLSDRQGTLLDGLFAVLSVVSVFLSESRAGLAAMLLYAGIYMLYRSRLIVLGVIGLIASLLLILVGVVDVSLTSLVDEDTLARSASLLAATDTSNLAGRGDIWAARVEFLNEDLSRWVMGVGFGNAVNSGSAAHMLPLHIILETGIVGLTVFVVLAWRVLAALWRIERHDRPIFWGTIALFLSSATQETFYPMPALGYFVGFYFVVLAVALQPHPERD